MPGWSADGRPRPRVGLVGAALAALFLAVAVVPHAVSASSRGHAVASLAQSRRLERRLAAGPVMHPPLGKPVGIHARRSPERIVDAGILVVQRARDHGRLVRWEHARARAALRRAQRRRAERLRAERAARRARAARAARKERAAASLGSQNGYTVTSHLTVEVTAYWPDPSWSNGYTATGWRAQYGVVAVDPQVIPLGTHLYIPGYGQAIAEDTGGAIIGDHVDVCFDSQAQAESWGVRWLTIDVER